MILAEKIMMLRKQNGWSQEELAAQLNVSRQSVSKWESTSSIPDLDKILKLSEIFGVSTDYLLKDEIEETEAAAATDRSDMQNEACRVVSLEEANTYMELVQRSSKRIAAGVSACILSPITVILLGGMSEAKKLRMTDSMASGIGVSILLLIIAGAVAIFVMDGMKLGKYEYLEKEVLSLQYGVAGIAERKKEEYEPIFKNGITLGVVLCILSVVPLMLGAAFEASDFTLLICVSLLLAVVAVAVFLFIRVGMVYGSYQKLLEEGDYTREKKNENEKNANLTEAYWCTATAIYLGYSFYTGMWNRSWIIWPCAGVLFAVVCAVARMIRRK